MSGADCLSPLRFFVWVLCVRAGIVCVSEDFVGFLVVRFSLLVGRSLEFNYVGFLLWSFVGFALTAVGSIVLADNGMG